MADPGILREFLVSLGYRIDSTGQAAFDRAMETGAARGAVLHQTIADVGKQLGILGTQLIALSEDPTRKTLDATDRIRKRHEELTKEVKNLGLVAIGTTSAFVAGFAEIARRYDDLYYVAQRTGATAGQLASLQFAGPQIGLSAQDMTAAVEALATAARNPGLQALLNSWGVASNDIGAFERHLRGLPPFLQDLYSQMFGVSTTFSRNWQNNWQVAEKAQADFERRARDAGLDYQQLTKDSVSATRDFETIWSQLGITMGKGFEEAYPYIDRVLKGVIDLMDETNKWNTTHPGAAFAEVLASMAVSSTVILAALGKMTSLFSVSGVLGGAARGAATAAGGGAWYSTGIGAFLSTLLYSSPAGSQGEGEAERRLFDQAKHAAGVPGYQQGGVVPYDQLARLHAGETVVPMEASRNLKDWLSGSSAYLPFVRVVGLEQLTFGAGSGVGSGVGSGGSHGGDQGSIEGLKTGTGSDFSVISDTIRQAGEKVGLNPQQIRMAQAGFLSAFDYESHLRHDIVRPHGTDTGWAQWVGSRLRHMAEYGDPRSLAANQKQLYYELTGAYRNSLLAAGHAEDPMHSALAAHYFESGGAAQFEGAVKTGHLAHADAFYRKLKEGALMPPPTTVNNDAGDRSVTMNQTNNNYLAPGDDTGRIAEHLNRHAGTLLRNAKAIINLMAAILDLSGAALQRQIVSPHQTFVSYVTLEEDHADDSVITEHPVEVGAIMSDHIYQRPPTVKLHLAWSNSDEAAGGDPGYAREVYLNLLTLKTARQLFIIYTGKRLYNNMFIISLRVHNDSKYEYALIAECEMKQLLLVSTQTVTGSPTSTTAGASSTPAANATPSTVPTTDTGTVQATQNSFNSLQSGTGPTQIPTGGGSTSNVSPDVPAPAIASPNSNNGGAGPPFIGAVL